MMKVRHVLCVVVLLFLYYASPAQIPRTISYQGVLSDTSGTPRPDGSYAMTFRLYSVPTGGSPLWNQNTVVQTRRGLFSVVLGDAAPFADSVRFNRAYWLGIQIGTDPELLPRMPLTSSGYSLTADTARVAGSLPSGSVTELMIGAGQVVKSLNGMRDQITLRAQGGATITSSNDTITINSGVGGGGTGIQGIQNTNNTLDILNPGGPTATVNLKVPLDMNGNSSSWIFSARNTGPGSAATFVTTNPNFGGVAVDVEALGGPNSGLAAVAYGSGTALIAQNTASGNAINASSSKGSAVYATSAGAPAVYAIGTGAFGVQASSDVSFGVLGQSNSGIGVYASSNSSIGLDASSVSDYAVHGQTTNGYAGVHGFGGHNGVFGETSSATDAGVFGRNNGTGYGMFGFSVGGTGVFGASQTGFAGFFQGRVAVSVLQINGGTDLAEPFDVEDDATAAPGTVMVLDPQKPGTLLASRTPYDHTVAGIVSGAGNIKPGITLRQDGVTKGRTMVAIAGRVYCKAEANSASIKPGDLLTTSSMAGYAMKANDRTLSQGAIIGKAMSSLEKGKGLVLVLVNLQ